MGPPGSALEIEVAPLVEQQQPSESQGASETTRRQHSLFRRTFSCLSHSALSVALLAVVLLLVLVRGVSFDDATAVDDGARPKEQQHREDPDGTKQLPPTSQEKPLILDAALGLVPPKPPEGKEYLPLEFVHATKTGGSAIEKAAAKHGIAWGACHYNCASFEDMKCPSRSPPQYFEGRVKSTRYPGSMLWHIPHHLWSPNLLEGHKTFTVVRNPYSRAVSEYYNKWDGFVGTDEERNDPSNMNTWIQTNLIERPKGIRYLQHSKYVYTDDGSKAVDVVLHFENLAAEFNALMESEGLPIRLDDTPFNELTGSALLGVEDLTNATIQKINDYAMDDFINFEYEPMLL